jgi:hypothetical protein
VCKGFDSFMLRRTSRAVLDDARRRLARTDPTAATIGAVRCGHGRSSAHGGHGVGGKRCGGKKRRGASKHQRDAGAPTRVSRVDALRHAGASWMEVLRTAEARKEITDAFTAGVRLGTRFPRAPGRVTRKALNTVKKWRQAAEGAVPVTALRHAGGSWLDVLTHPEFKTQLWNARPFQPVWLRQGAMDAAERAGQSGAESIINPAVFLRHAGASRLETMMHEKVRQYYWAQIVATYVSTVVERPFFTAMFSSVAKCVSSDIFVQVALEHRSVFDLDWNRVASFFILGVTYVGAFQYRLYNHVLKPLNDAWRPKYGLALSTGGVVFIDQAFFQPFVYLPTFLGIRIMSEGGTKIVDLPGSVVSKWIETGPDTMKALWLVWVPAQAINFAVIPKHLTIPWMNAIGLVWNGVLSFMHGSIESEKEEPMALPAGKEEGEEDHK